MAHSKGPTQLATLLVIVFGIFSGICYNVALASLEVSQALLQRWTGMVWTSSDDPAHRQ
jgi:hypothetical protein